MTVSELSAYLKIGEKSLLRMANKGDLPGLKVGSQWRFPKVVIDDWLSSRMRHTSDEAIVDVVRRADKNIPLSRLMYPGKVIMNINPGSKQEVLRQLIVPLLADSVIGDADGFVLKLLERERMVSTAVGRGIALPHPRHPDEVHATRSAVVFGRCPDGTDFESPDGKPTHLFFLVCATGEVVHLRIMSRLAWMLRDARFADQLKTAATEAEILSSIVSKEAEYAQAEQQKG